MYIERKRRLSKPLLGGEEAGLSPQDRKTNKRRTRKSIWKKSRESERKGKKEGNTYGGRERRRVKREKLWRMRLGSSHRRCGG